jgi:hypothetical protein
MMKLVLLLAVIAVATALSSEDPHAEAKEAIADLLQKGKDDSQCRELAKDTIKGIKKDIEAAQKLADVYDKGHNCHTSGQSEVTKAKQALNKATTKLKQARDKKKKKCSAKVKLTYTKTWSVSYTVEDDFNVGKKCVKVGDHYRSQSKYTKAKKACSDAKTAVAKAEGEESEAKSLVTTMEAAAKKKKKECYCRVQKKHKEVKKVVAASHTDAKVKAWRKAHHMLCVLDGTAPAQCKVSGMKKVNSGKVASGVTKAKCEAYTKKYSKKWPHCSNIECPGTFSKASYEAMCNNFKTCTGFSFTAGKDKGKGCLKKCGKKEFNGFGLNTYDYWVKK